MESVGFDYTDIRHLANCILQEPLNFTHFFLILLLITLQHSATVIMYIFLKCKIDGTLQSNQLTVCFMSFFLWKLKVFMNAGILCIGIQIHGLGQMKSFIVTSLLWIGFPYGSDDTCWNWDSIYLTKLPPSSISWTGVLLQDMLASAKIEIEFAMCSIHKIFII